jgi:predicted acylesterase/phospholipase RssA
MTERYRRRDFGHLDLEVMLSDPAAYAKPWTVAVRAELAADTELIEWVCNENNNGAQHWVGKASDERKSEVKVAPAILAKYVGAYVEQPPLWRILQHARRGTPNIVTILMAAGSHGSDAILRAMRAQVDLLIQTPLHQFGCLDWKEFDTAVEAGYQSAKRVLEEKGEQLFGSRDRAILPGSV